MSLHLRVVSADFGIQGVNLSVNIRIIGRFLTTAISLRPILGHCPYLMTSLKNEVVTSMSEQAIILMFISKSITVILAMTSR